MPIRLTLVLAFFAAAPLTAQQTPSGSPDPRLAGLKKAVLADIDARSTFTQQMVDQLFSYGELGFQEVETS